MAPPLRYKIEGKFSEGAKQTRFRGIIDLTNGGPLGGGRLIDADGQESRVVEPVILFDGRRFELEFYKDYENRALVNGRILYVYRLDLEREQVLEREPCLSADGCYYPPRGGGWDETECTLVLLGAVDENQVATDWKKLKAEPFQH